MKPKEFRVPRDNQEVFSAFGVKSEDYFGIGGLDDSLNFGPAERLKLVSEGSDRYGIELDFHAHYDSLFDTKISPAKMKFRTARTIMISAGTPVTILKLATP